MTKSLKIISAIFLLFFASAPLLHAVEPLKDPFYNQGQEIQNPPPVYSIQETVDPFSGNLKLVHTDVHLPGNDGLDINIVRTYDSSIWGRRDTQVYLGQKPNSPLGIGWSMHMGIVRNPDAMQFDTVFNSANPVFEMPDGSQHMLYRAKTGSNTFISKERGIYIIYANGISKLTLADGTVYTFQNNTVAGYSGWDAINIAQVTRIENAANDAWITIAYDKTSGTGIGLGYSYIKTISDSTGRQITFNWDFTKHHLTSIYLGSQKLISYLLESAVFSILSSHAALPNALFILKSNLSITNFVKVASGDVPNRYSERVLFNARDVTCSEGRTPGRIVRSQEPNLAQTRSGTQIERYCKSPWAMSPT